jgi:hypothetical protein
MAPRARLSSRVLRRPASARSQRAVTQRRSRSRAVPFVTRSAADLNIMDFENHPVLMDFADGGLMTLDASLCPLKRKERGGHHVYQLDIQMCSQDETGRTGIHGTIVSAIPTAWLTRRQFLQAASRLGSSAEELVLIN